MQRFFIKKGLTNSKQWYIILKHPKGATDMERSPSPVYGARLELVYG